MEHQTKECKACGGKMVYTGSDRNGDWYQYTECENVAVEARTED